MIAIVSLIVLLRELLVPTITCCIPTSPFIQVNDFYTCICKGNIQYCKGVYKACSVITIMRDVLCLQMTIMGKAMISHTT